MENFLSLKILDKFKILFEKSGIDYKMLREIVKIKLVLDGRRAPAIGNNQNKKSESEHFSMMKRFFLHLIFGAFLGFFIYFIKDEMIRMIYFTGAFFFMTTMYLISDFSFVLLDTKDKNIIMTKPVNSKTLSVSKFLHILIYMFQLNVFIAGPSLIAIVLTDGPLAIPVFILEIFLMDLLIFLITTFIYLAVLKFFDGELLRNIINLIQIALTVLVTVGYQIAIRMIDFSNIQNIEYKFEPVNYFNPILWFGAPFEIIFNEGRAVYLYVFSVLMIVIPLLSLVIYLKLSKKTESLLLKLEGEGKEKLSKHIIEKLLNKMLNRDEEGRQSFHFANAILRSDRSLKLKIYPALATGLLFPVIMILNIGMSGTDYEITGYEYLYLYFNFLVFPSSLDLVQYSSAWKGSYVYTVSGFDNINKLFKGILQALAVRLLIPLIILNSLVYIGFFKEKFAVDIIILLLASILSLPVFSIIYFKTLPFSRPVEESNQRSIDKFFMSLAVTFIFAALHFISYIIPFGIWIYLGLLTTGIPVSWKFLVPRTAEQNS